MITVECLGQHRKIYLQITLVQLCGIALELDFVILIVPIVPLVLGLALQLSIQIGHIAELYAAYNFRAGGEQHADVKPLGHALVNARCAFRAAGLGLRAVGNVADLADVRQKRADGIAVVRIARLLAQRMRLPIWNGSRP